MIWYDDYKNQWVITDEIIDLEDDECVVVDDWSFTFTKADKPHNINGPAVLYPGGKTEYWICGEKVSEERFNKLRKFI